MKRALDKEPLMINPADPAGLRIQWEWQRDRYRHRICVGPPEKPICLIGSSAEDWDSDWPRSAPLQQLSVEDRADGRVALLVGMAGKSHWSASIEMRADPVGLRFDFACRISRPAGWIGCSYDVGFAPRPAAGGLVWTIDQQVYRLRPSAEDTLLRSCAEQLEFRPATTEVDSQTATRPRTLRWQYELIRG